MNTYSYILLTYIDGKTHKFVYNDVNKCRKIFGEYRKRIQDDKEKGICRILEDSDDKIWIELMYHLAPLKIFSGVEKMEEIGFD